MAICVLLFRHSEQVCCQKISLKGYTLLEKKVKLVFRDEQKNKLVPIFSLDFPFVVLLWITDM